MHIREWAMEKVKLSPLYWILPIVAFIIFSFFSADIDLKVSRHFYVDGHFQDSPFLQFFYHYGFFPGWILAGIGFCFLFNRNLRQIGIYLLLTLAIGSGLIIHEVLKEHWGRPRPRQTIEFNGTQPYKAYYQPHFNTGTDPSKSFPSGHSSMGFYFFAVMFLGLRLRNKKLFWTGLFFALVLGILLSYTRIAMGGHYLTDTIVSALVMWLTAFWLLPVMKSGRVDEVD